jgi:type IV pilus assembly protein PilN
MRAKIKKLKPEYERYSKLFHSKSEVEGLLQTLSEYAGQNDLVITSIEKKEFKVINTSLKLSKTLKSNKELTYRILAQVASSVPNRVKFDQVVFNGSNRLTIQGLAATDQDILKFIENLSKQKLVEQASLSSMRLPKSSAGSATMKGFRVFVKIKRSTI